MGCCLSTKPPPPSPPPSPSPSPFPHHHSSKSSRAPPPVEEETVKEVLSETPTIPNLHFSKPTPNHHHEEDVSISSEICSNMSETISTGTTFEDDGDGFRRRVTERSPTKLRNRQNNSPVRGKHQSPGRVRSVSETNNRGSGFGSAGRQRPMAASREVSRSRSPANRTAGRGGGGGGGRKSPAARKMDNSPGRVRPRLPLTKPELSSVREREREERSNWSPLEINGEEDESIDNPLVSLECFIFL